MDDWFLLGSKSNRSASRRLFNAILTVGALSLVVSLVMAIREIFVARIFGTGDQLDALILGMMLPFFAVAVLGRSLTAALVPSYVQVLKTKGEHSAAALMATTLRYTCVILLLGSVLLAGVGYAVLPLLASKFSQEKLRMARQVLLILSPLLILSGIGALLSGLLNARMIFGRVTAVPVLTPLIVIVMFILYPERVTIIWVSLATLAGMSIETALLFLMTRKYIELGSCEHIRSREILRQWVPLMAGALLMASTVVVDSTMAAALESGSVSVLRLGSKVVALGLAIGASAIGTAFLPHFSTMVVAKEWQEIRISVTRYSLLMALLCTPVVVAVIVYAEPILKTVFEGGALDAADTIEISKVHSMYALQIPFYLIGMMLVRLASAMQINKIIARVAAVNLVANIVLNYLLINIMGVSGIALSTSIVYFLSTLMLAFSLSSRLSGLQNKGSESP